MQGPAQKVLQVFETFISLDPCFSSHAANCVRSSHERSEMHSTYSGEGSISSQDSMHASIESAARPHPTILSQYASQPSSDPHAPKMIAEPSAAMKKMIPIRLFTSSPTPEARHSPLAPPGALFGRARQRRRAFCSSSFTKSRGERTRFHLYVG